MSTRKIIFYEKHFDLARGLTDRQLGRVMRALFECFIDNDERGSEKLSKEEAVLYGVMHYEIKANLDKYEEICEKRREAARKGAERKKQIKQMHANAGNNKNNNKNINNNKNNNINNNNNDDRYDFEEIERLALARRIKNQS